MLINTNPEIRLIGTFITKYDKKLFVFYMCLEWLRTALASDADTRNQTPET